MNYDHDEIGVGNSRHPANEKYVKSENDLLQDRIDELELKLKQANDGAVFRHNQLKDVKMDVDSLIDAYSALKGKNFLLNKLKSINFDGV